MSRLTPLLALAALLSCATDQAKRPRQPDDTSVTSADLAELDSLESRLETIAARAGGSVAISVVHVESGREAHVRGPGPQPLHSVFKLPLAVAVLEKVQVGSIDLDQIVTVTGADRAPGVSSNRSRWVNVPRAASILTLLTYSLVDSDNTASDVLLEVIGGPAALTERMKELGFEEILVRANMKDTSTGGTHVNTGSAQSLAGLLASLQRGEILPKAQRDVLWELMRRARTGERRIRAGVPKGTQVIDKTGSGRDGAATNDAGIVTLPRGRGHLAIAVLIAGSPLDAADQEDLIAEVARLSFRSFSGEIVTEPIELPGKEDARR